MTVAFDTRLVRMSGNGEANHPLSEPIVRLVYERGEWTPESTELTADALFWFAFSLPFSGFVLMLTRAFFSLQRPWVPTTTRSACWAWRRTWARRRAPSAPGPNTTRPGNASYTKEGKGGMAPD